MIFNTVDFTLRLSQSIIDSKPDVIGLQRTKSSFTLNESEGDRLATFLDIRIRLWSLIEKKGYAFELIQCEHTTRLFFTKNA